MKVINDDGSSGNKQVFRCPHTNELKQHLVENTFSRGKKTGVHPINKKPYYSYHVGDEPSLNHHMYGADKLMETLEFQMSTHSILSTHIGLHQTGLTDQNIELICTLPISAYFDPHTFAVNQDLIDRKIAHMMKTVSPDNNKLAVANIVSCEVMPECLPFVAQQLMLNRNINDRDMILGIDQGGSTVDLFSSDAGTLTPTLIAHELLGFNSVINWILSTTSGQGCNVYDAREILKNKSFGDDFIGNDELLNQRIDDLVSDIIGFITNQLTDKLLKIRHIFITGGPSVLLQEKFTERNIFHDKATIYVSDNPEFALAHAIAELEGI